MKILFFVPYPVKESPSQRFRFEQYFELLERAGFKLEVQSFLTTSNWTLFYKSGRYGQKAIALLLGFVKRFVYLFKAYSFDFIFIHREVAPIGPPIFEWILAVVFRKKIIYDFDDAIWLTDREDESNLMRVVKWRSKVKSICRWSYKVSCGNIYLKNYALKVNDCSLFNPTTVDTENHHNPLLYLKPLSSKIVIGWTGSHSTLKYLFEIQDALKSILSINTNVELLIIADRKPDLKIPFTFLPWRSETEIQDLLKLDIGLMPLPDDEWAKGKCGFKAIQYMSLNINAIVSNVGVNASIVDHGINGFVCRTKEDWLTYLEVLVNDETLRRKMGSACRQKIVEHYSVSSNSSRFLSLFE